jgi:hypothetical protein
VNTNERETANELIPPMNDAAAPPGPTRVPRVPLVRRDEIIFFRRPGDNAKLVVFNMPPDTGAFRSFSSTHAALVVRCVCL